LFTFNFQVFPTLENATGQTIQMTSTNLCDKCKLILNYHDKFSLKVKSIEDKLNDLMAPKFEETYDENLEIEKIEILSDNEETQTERLHHEKKSKIFTCELCSKTFENKLAFKVHKKMEEINSRTVKKDLMCEHCGDIFLTSSTFTNHKKKCSEQNMFGPWKCSFENCVRIFDEYEKFKKHKRYHAVMKAQKKMKKDPCTICGKEFSQGYRMSRHMKFHTKEKNYLCPLCPNRYTQNYNLLAHVKQHHSHIYQETSTNSRFSRPNFICDYCNAHFIKVDSFREHYEQVHNIYQSLNS
jgi:hypothetical protein